MPRALSSSPTLLPDIVTNVFLGGSQSSSAGRASPITVPKPVFASIAFTLPAAEPLTTVAPQVCPATRFSAPGVDGPKVVPNELSLMENACE